MDTGIPEMLVFLEDAKRPSLIKGGTVFPDHVAITVTLPIEGQPILRYSFTTGEGGSVMAPSCVQFFGNQGHNLNTGRAVLKGAAYLFDAAGGRMGIKLD